MSVALRPTNNDMTSRTVTSVPLWRHVKQWRHLSPDILIYHRTFSDAYVVESYNWSRCASKKAQDSTMTSQKRDVITTFSPMFDTDQNNPMNSIVTSHKAWRHNLTNLRETDTVSGSYWLQGDLVSSRCCRVIFRNFLSRRIFFSSFEITFSLLYRF